MTPKPPCPHGMSYRGPLSIRKNNKLTLPADLYQFFVRAMKAYKDQTVLLAIHAIEPASSIWDFIGKLGGRHDD